LISVSGTTEESLVLDMCVWNGCQFGRGVVWDRLM